MIEELFINGSQVDIEKVDIVRRYISPYFGDVTKLRNNGTYTVKLPLTINNSAIFEHCYRPDMFTAKPYTILRADYYYEGFPIFLNAETKVLGYEQGFIEVQFVYGVDRDRYLPLFDKKLNEIIPNGTTILETDWVVNWDKDHYTGSTVATKKYKYIDYVHRELTSDIITLNGVVQPKVEPDELIIENIDAMSLHPFVSFNDMLDLIIKNGYTPVSVTAESNPINNKIVFEEDVSTLLNVGDRMYSLDGNILTGSNIISFDDAYTVVFDEDVSMFYEVGAIAVFVQPDIIDFTPIKNRLLNHGLILGGRKDNFNYQYTFTYAINPPELSDKLYLGDYIHSGIVSKSEYYISYIQNVINNYKSNVVLKLNFTIDNAVGGLILYRDYYDTETETTVSEAVKTIPYQGLASGEIIYNTNVEFEIVSDDDKLYQYYIKFTNGAIAYTMAAGGTIIFSYSLDESIFMFVDYYGNSNGRYNCLFNLPDISLMEFINQMLILSGCFLYPDENGEATCITLADFKSNLDNGVVYDWSGKVSNIHKGSFQFNSNAQKNWLRFANYLDVNYENDEYLQVLDETIELEKDLYKIEFDLADKAASGISEFILYEQESKSNGETDPLLLEKTFTNKYVSKNSVCVYDVNGIAYNEPVLPINNEFEKYITIIATSPSTNVIDISDYYEVGIIVPIVGNSVKSIDGVELNDVYVVYVDYANGTVTLNSNIITDALEHIVVFKFDIKGFIQKYYPEYQKLIERPIVVECDVNLGFYESATIDFTKPIYIEEFGKYCMLLELQAPNRELCAAKFLLINQIL